MADQKPFHQWPDRGGGGRVDHRPVHDIFQPGGLQQGMAGTHDEIHLFLIKLREAEVLHDRRIAKPPDHHADRTIPELIDQIGNRPVQNAQRRRGRQAFELCHGARQQRRRDRGQRAYTDLGAFACPIQLRDAIQPVIQCGQAHIREMGKDLSGIGQADPRPVADQQHLAKDLFKLLQGFGHRRLSQVQPIRRALQAALPHGLGEALDVAQFDPAADQFVIHLGKHIGRYVNFHA